MTKDNKSTNNFSKNLSALKQLKKMIFKKKNKLIKAKSISPQIDHIKKNNIYNAKKNKMLLKNKSTSKI